MKLSKIVKYLALLSLLPLLSVACNSEEPSTVTQHDNHADVTSTGEGADQVTDTGRHDDAGMSDSGDSTISDVVQHDSAEMEVSGEDAAVFSSQGTWGPSGRIVSLSTPESPRAARQLGCQVFGENVGIGLSNLVLLAGGLDQYLVPDESGQIPLHMVAVLEGFSGGDAISDRETFGLNLFYATLDESGETLLRRDAFTDGDPDMTAVNNYTAAVVNSEGWFESTAGDFLLVTPVFEDLILAFTIELASFTGKLKVDGDGVGGEMLMTGYLTRSTLIGFLTDIRDECLGEDPPQLCNLIGGLINEDTTAEDLLDVGLGLINGFDANVTNGYPYSCGPNSPEARECNAASVCILLELEGSAVKGVAPE